MIKKPLTAARLRVILTLSLGAITLIGAGAFTFADSQLRRVAIETNHTTVDASASQNNITTLQKVQTILAAEQTVIERASSIVADSKSYQYQDQIITDLNGFASRNSVTITNVDFGSTQGAGATAAPTTTTPAVSGGVKSTSAVVTLKTPVNYNNLLRFIESIEQNLTKMQVSKVSLSRGSSTGRDVTSDALTIEVYIR